MSNVQEIRIGKITAKVFDDNGAKVLDVRRHGGGIVFMGFIDVGKWLFLKMALEKIEGAMERAGWI